MSFRVTCAQPTLVMLVWCDSCGDEGQVGPPSVSLEGSAFVRFHGTRGNTRCKQNTDVPFKFSNSFVPLFFFFFFCGKVVPIPIIRGYSERCPKFLHAPAQTHLCQLTSLASGCTCKRLLLFLCKQRL